MPRIKNNATTDISLYNGKEDYYVNIEAGETVEVSRRVAEFVENFEQPFSLEIIYDPDATTTKATNSIIGSTKLSVAAASAANPIAVGDNDSRMLTSQNKTDVLAHVAEVSSDVHGVIPLIPKSSTTVLGTVKLSAAPTDADSPVAVGTNDAGLLTAQNKTDVLAHIADVTGDPHSMGTFAFTQLRLVGTGTNPGTYAITVVDGALVATLV